jgi:hypothetical protein
MSTEQKIVAWADWSRRNNPVRELGYKSPSLTLMRQNMGGGVSLPSFSDDDAMRVDAAVVRLGARQPELHQVLVMYFLHGRSQQSIATTSKTCRQEINLRIQKAITWIDGQLDGVDVDAA